MLLGLATQNHEKIEFYGRLVDQFSAPVARATVTGYIQVNSGFRSGADEVKTSTDADGFFQFKGHRGKTLGITPIKPGYVLATTDTSFVYSKLWPAAQRHIPDPNKPVEIKMWKLQGAEPVLKIDKAYGLRFTDGPILFDLVTGTICTNGGDIRLTFTRGPGVLTKESPGDWSVLFEPVDGGLMAREFPEYRKTYQAPSAGYEKSLLVRMRADDRRGWYGGIDRYMFLSSRGGRVYSKMQVEVAINSTPEDDMWIQFRGVANTNSSRNWEATVGQ